MSTFYGSGSASHAGTRGAGAAGASTQSSGESLPQGSGVLKWSSQINQVAKELGIPPDVIAAIMETESSGDPQATGPATSDGSRARGLMQVMDFNWGPGEDKYDPLTNIRKGAQMLKERYDRAKQQYGVDDNRAWEIAAASYLGDWSWSQGSYAGSQDAFGTNGPTYVQKFDANRKKYQGLGTSAGSSATGSDLRIGAVLQGANYSITQGYGQTDFAQNSGMYRSGFHDGIDVGIGSGTKLYAPGHGTVIFAGLGSGTLNGYGGTVQIKLDNGYIIQFSHLRSINVQQGQQINLGMYFGDSGGNQGDWGHGASTGAHLHVRVLDANGNSVDPRKLIQF